MGDLYASVVATTILQIKALPPRPEEYDGKLCLWGVLEGVGEVQIVAALEQHGTISSCVLGKPTVVVLISGGTLSLGGLRDAAPAIVFAPYGGEAGGVALAEVLFGKRAASTTCDL